MMQVLMTVSANLPEEILIGNHPRMRVVETVGALDESQVTSRWASRLVGEVQAADPETPEEVETVMRMNEAEMRIPTVTVVVGAEEEQEVRETQGDRRPRGTRQLWRLRQRRKEEPTRHSSTSDGCLYGKNDESYTTSRLEE